MNYFGTFSSENARFKIQRNTFASFIYKGRKRYSQAEKSFVAMARETQAMAKDPPQKFSSRGFERQRCPERFAINSHFR